MAFVFRPGKVTCMEATKSFMIQNLLDCHILPGELAFSNVGCPLNLYLGRQSHKSNPTLCHETLSSIGLGWSKRLVNSYLSDWLRSTWKLIMSLGPSLCAGGRTWHHIVVAIRPLPYNSLFLITTVDAPGCGRQSSSLLISNLYTSKQLLQHFLHCIWVNLVNFRVEGISRTLLALRLHSRTPSSCSACWASNTCKPYWPRISINYQKRCVQ